MGGEKPTNGGEPVEPNDAEAELRVADEIVPELLPKVPESQREAFENLKQAVLHPPEIDND